ncbi:menaquinone-dependent protoporphyrinogen IX dehydrogenase [Pantoea sp. Nvir]|uniref:menaquinone-dependent protoporphyrinogen IX dehydrogenase n=1 Tax=Pantoea sp. Nvir TaxID=2576760 RepID=UPI001356A8F5|nr:menaquinone-dependent protoporphyrinogen IX dehydrogenase [Pantoea sp. Nvir]MXP66899.1 menaquinone-dependent protoporphyrinogen IX dehydrogenase [Pantoea sp. Nvir]
MKVLILFCSYDGQTRKIASYVASVIKEQQSSDVLNLLYPGSIDWKQYNRVLIGASIRYGHLHPEVSKFVKMHLCELQQRVGGFFCVNLTARKLNKNSPQTNIYTRKFLYQSPWKPEYCKAFAGALRYPRYRWFDRIMIQLIMYIMGGETDSTKEVEYTDWQQVEHFARKFVQLPIKLV